MILFPQTSPTFESDAQRQKQSDTNKYGIYIVISFDINAALVWYSEQ